MGNICTKKNDAVEVPPIQISYYSLRFTYYISPLKDQTLEQLVINDALRKCLSKHTWISYLNSLYKNIEPKCKSIQNVSVKLFKLSKITYIGELNWSSPAINIDALNNEIIISSPICAYNFDGNKWSGMCFLELIQEVPSVIL